MFKFKHLFIGPQSTSDDKPPEAYVQQLRLLKKVWADDTYGLERLVRLFLCAIQFVFPVLLVRDAFGRGGFLSRKLAVEAYTVFKFLFPLFVLSSGLYQNPLIVFIIIYLLSETVLHILNIIFLSDIYGVSMSYHRSILLLFVHYMEVIFDFAVIYIGFDLLNQDLTPVSALYFSMVANTTVGFGDICARGAAGQIAVMAQLVIGVLFIFVFINYFSQKINEK
ncbi:MAG TPA: potassium channel family protein [Candidatus Omnitrophota bacterium]|nr:potassium channel family protein [Candidatus Omnitrophota bacterium]HPD84847.1 potassium channel family protein [Candidatus Omnitrophota bacterium]HRZ03705.1 potassium channel family protein [Candidatus Omnitrophota bacterium]